MTGVVGWKGEGVGIDRSGVGQGEWDRQEWGGRGESGDRQEWKGSGDRQERGGGGGE